MGANFGMAASLKPDNVDSLNIGSDKLRRSQSLGQKTSRFRRFPPYQGTSTECILLSSNVSTAGRSISDDLIPEHDTPHLDENVKELQTDFIDGHPQEVFEEKVRSICKKNSKVEMPNVFVLFTDSNCDTMFVVNNEPKSNVDALAASAALVANTNNIHYKTDSEVTLSRNIKTNDIIYDNERDSKKIKYGEWIQMVQKQKTQELAIDSVSPRITELNEVPTSMTSKKDLKQIEIKPGNSPKIVVSIFYNKSVRDYSVGTRRASVKTTDHSREFAGAECSYCKVKQKSYMFYPWTHCVNGQVEKPKLKYTTETLLSPNNKTHEGSSSKLLNEEIEQLNFFSNKKDFEQDFTQNVNFFNDSAFDLVSTNKSDSISYDYINKIRKRSRATSNFGMQLPDETESQIEEAIQSFNYSPMSYNNSPNIHSTSLVSPTMTVTTKDAATTTERLKKDTSLKSNRSVCKMCKDFAKFMYHLRSIEYAIQSMPSGLASNYNSSPYFMQPPQKIVCTEKAVQHESQLMTRSTNTVQPMSTIQSTELLPIKLSHTKFSIVKNILRADMEIKNKEKKPIRILVSKRKVEPKHKTLVETDENDSKGCRKVDDQYSSGEFQLNQYKDDHSVRDQLFEDIAATEFNKYLSEVEYMRRRRVSKAKLQCSCDTCKSKNNNADMEIICNTAMLMNKPKIKIPKLNNKKAISTVEISKKFDNMQDKKIRELIDKIEKTSAIEDSNKSSQASDGTNSVKFLFGPPNKRKSRYKLTGILNRKIKTKKNTTFDVGSERIAYTTPDDTTNTSWGCTNSSSFFAGLKSSAGNLNKTISSKTTLQKGIRKRILNFLKRKLI